MFYVGIDVSMQKHDCCVINESHKPVSRFTVLNNAKGFQSLREQLYTIASPDEIQIGLEATGVYGDNLVNFLKRNGFDVCTINPLLSKKYQSAGTLRKTKTDKSDANNIALIIASEAFQPDVHISYHISELKSLTRARFLTVKDRSALKNKVKRLIVLLFPELLNEFSDIFGAAAFALLKKYPSAKLVASARCSSLEKLLTSASRGSFRHDKAEQLLLLAKNSVGTHSGSLVLELRMYLERIEMLNRQVEVYEEEIKRIMDEINSPITTVKGIGFVLGASILAEIGDIKRFSSPSKLLAFAGLEPSIYQSGKFTPSSGKMVKRGSPFLRYALMLAAGSVSIYSSTFATYRQKKLDEGKPYNVARSHIAKKLVRVIFSLLSHNFAFADNFAA